MDRAKINNYVDIAKVKIHSPHKNMETLEKIHYIIQYNGEVPQVKFLKRHPAD